MGGNTGAGWQEGRFHPPILHNIAVEGVLIHVPFVSSLLSSLAPHHHARSPRTRYHTKPVRYNRFRVTQIKRCQLTAGADYFVLNQGSHSFSGPF